MLNGISAHNVNMLLVSDPVLVEKALRSVNICHL